jgi:aspartyl-tRNA(Asn)/glutamyl-tRNA(Gln) amidotransferase subunit A
MLFCFIEPAFLMNDLSQPYHVLRGKLLSGETSCVDVVRRHLGKIDQFNGQLNAFLEVYSEGALFQAELIDQKIASNVAGKLAGMVIGIKDLLCYENHHSSAGSLILNSFKSTFSATAVQRLIDEDAIIIGRQNCDEFGMGSTNENSAYGPVLNYLNKEYVSGGSSGGSAVAVQADMCQVSLGTDTGGSIRMPASFCGIVGLKPTYGYVSRWGLIAYASSFDSIGPMSKHLDDIKLVLDVISGSDGQDSTLVNDSTHHYSRHKKVAYFKEMVEHPSLQKEIRDAFFIQIEKLKLKGYLVDSIDFPFLEQLLPTYYVLTTAESSSNLSRFDGVKFGFRSEGSSDLIKMYKRTRNEGFGEEVKRRIMLGTFVLSADYYDAYYTKAQKVRRLVKEYTEQMLTNYDFLISPTTSSTAYKLGEKTKNPLQMYLGDLFTVQANITGLPSISVPMGVDENNLPMGFQVLGKYLDENEMIEFSRLINEK